MKNFKVVWPRFWSKLYLNTEKHIGHCIHEKHPSFSFVTLTHSYKETARFLVDSIRAFLKKSIYMDFVKFKITRANFDEFCFDIQVHTQNLIEKLFVFTTGDITAKDIKGITQSLAFECTKPIVDAVRKFLKIQ